MTDMLTNAETLDLAAQIRIRALEMVTRAHASHLGGALSMADIVAVLYGQVLRVRPEEPEWQDRDRFILSKGHCCSALYAALALRGFIPEAELLTYGQDGARLMAHISHKVPGVDFSTGSLGHGLPFACGRALAAKRRGKNWRVFVILGDGEMDEGSNWEAILFAPHHKLDNLVAIIDCNKIQSLGNVSDIENIEPLADKFRAFHWAVREIDGHEPDAIRAALNSLPWEPGRPNCIIARTVKGKGVSFMENELLWHYRSPNADQLRQAVDEINARNRS
jgi:transketolase